MCEFQNLAGVIVGGLLGIAGGVATGVAVKVFENRQQKLNLMSALAGELRAILTAVE
jgi:hypothetical protein